jgi:phosphoribosylformimino-5-aminoimidazole carboxamide ribotide isomerase
MLVLPAIDLKGGRCVRLLRGEMSTAVVYGDDPAEMARRWAGEGAEYLHVVDLDGAFAGSPVNGEAIRSICAAVDVPVEVGGGIRDAGTAGAVLDAGAARVVLGTAAYREPALVERLCREFPGRLAVGIDARGDAVAGEGWTEDAGVTARVLAEQMVGVGVTCVIYTDIRRDGTGQGPNIDGVRTMARALATRGVSLIASGGVGCLADVERVAALAPEGVAGLIIGRALYTGAVSLREALAVSRGPVGTRGGGHD